MWRAVWVRSRHWLSYRDKLDDLALGLHVISVPDRHFDRCSSEKQAHRGMSIERSYSKAMAYSAARLFPGFMIDWHEVNPFGRVLCTVAGL